MRTRTAIAASVGMLVVGLCGCGTATTGAGGTSGASTAPVVTTTSSPAGSGSPSSGGPVTTSGPPATSRPGPAPSSARDRTFHGTVGGIGLTCIVFRAKDGKQYSLTGKAVPARIKQIAHSGFQQGNRKQQKATLTVVGHVAPHLMSTCGMTTLVASKVTITSVGPAAVPAT